MKKILISLTEKQHLLLSNNASEHEICLSELIRRIFDIYIEKYIKEEKQHVKKIKNAGVKNE